MRHILLTQQSIIHKPFISEGLLQTLAIIYAVESVGHFSFIALFRLDKEWIFKVGIFFQLHKLVESLSNSHLSVVEERNKRGNFHSSLDFFALFGQEGRQVLVHGVSVGEFENANRIVKDFDALSPGK